MRSATILHIGGRGPGLWRGLLILFSFAFILSSAFAQGGAWIKKSNIPTARTGGAACVVNGKIYLLGGYNISGTEYSSNEMYDPVTDSWQAKRPMPTARGFLSAAVVDGIIYAIGGGYPTAKATVEAYDPLTDSWTTKASLPAPRLGAHAAVVDGIIYNIGGNCNERNCDAYDPLTNTWTAKSPMPEAGGVVGITVQNDLIYVMGGGLYAVFNTVYVYDPKIDHWTKKADMPTPRFAFQSYLVDGKIYAVGGAPSPDRSLATVEVYDPVINMWDTKANMPEKAAWFAGTVAAGKIYVMGGTADSWTGAYSVWEFDPAFHTDVAAGEVSGTWVRSNSPYRVNGEITVPNGGLLRIEPGVEVVFAGHYKLNVQGRLLAEGTGADPVFFTADDAGRGWHGLRFINTPAGNDSSKLVHCQFRYGKANTGGWTSSDRCGGALMIQGFSKVLVMHCSFERNMNSGDISTTGGAAIFIRSASPRITKNTFSSNTGTTDCALMSYYSDVIISDNVFTNNSGCHGPVTCAYGYNTPVITGNRISNNVTTRAGGGIFTMTTNAIIANNIITYNSCFGGEGEGGGIKCWVTDRPLIINNTVAYNSATRGGGICCNQDADPILINNIVWENSSSDGSQVNCMDAGSDPSFFFCDIQGGKEAFGGGGSGVYYGGSFENNIDVDPLFKDTASGDLRLSDYSRCIGAGTDSLTIGGTTYRCPPLCMMGTIRPSPSGSRPDLGACENLLREALTGVEQVQSAPGQFALMQNYPNPFNPVTVINYTVGEGETGRGGEGVRGSVLVQLSVYDVLGRQVAILVNEPQRPGSYEVIFDARGLASGVYFCRLTAGDPSAGSGKSFVQTRKLVLLR